MSTVVEDAIRAASPDVSAAGAELAAIALQESDWRDLPPRDNGARGVWQIRPATVLKEVKEEDARRAKRRRADTRLFAVPMASDEPVDQGVKWSGAWQARIAAWYLTQRIPEILRHWGAPTDFAWRAWAYVTGPVEIGRLFKEKGGPLDWEAFVQQWQVPAIDGAWKPSKLAYVRRAVADLRAIHDAKDPQISGPGPVTPFPLIQFPTFAFDAEIPFDSLRARTVLKYWRPRKLDARGDQTTEPLLFESDLEELQSYGARRWGKGDAEYAYRALFGGKVGRGGLQEMAIDIADAMPSAEGIGAVVLIIIVALLLWKR